MNTGAAQKQDGHDMVAMQCRDGEVGGKDIISSHEEAAANVEIPSSAMGEVKKFLNCSSVFWGLDLPLSSRDQLLKMIEGKCIQSYKINDCNFSVLKLL